MEPAPEATIAEDASHSKKRPRTDPGETSMALVKVNTPSQGDKGKATSSEAKPTILMDSPQLRLVADINPLLIKRLEARNEIGFRRLLGNKRPTFVVMELNVPYFRACITDVMTGVLRHRYHHSGSYRTSEIEAEIKDIVPYVVDMCCSALYAKFRSIHKSYGTKGTRYTTSPLYTKEIELPLPLALAIEQFGSFETHSLVKNVLIAPTFPEGVTNEGRSKTEFIATQYLAYIPTFKELGIPCKTVDTRQKTGTPWWTYRIQVVNDTADLVCMIPASHYTDLSADLRLLFLSTQGEEKKFEQLIIFPDAYKKLDYGTRDREERSGSNIRTFLALCHGPEEEWTHGA